jgi:hypothetical protein
LPQEKEEQMNRKNSILLAFMTAFGLLALGWTQSGVKAAPARRTLKVKLNYTGAGQVDEKHKIYVLLFDANPFTAKSLIDMTSQSATTSNQTAPPAQAPEVCHILSRQGTTDKDKTLTFSDLHVSPVYAAAFYDKSGTYDGHSELVSGSPLGVYGKQPDKLEPIKLAAAKTVEVLLTFDDSTTTP